MFTQCNKQDTEMILLVLNFKYVKLQSVREPQLSDICLLLLRDFLS